MLYRLSNLQSDNFGFDQLDDEGHAMFNAGSSQNRSPRTFRLNIRTKPADSRSLRWTFSMSTEDG